MTKEKSPFTAFLSRGSSIVSFLFPGGPVQARLIERVLGTFMRRIIERSVRRRGHKGRIDTENLGQVLESYDIVLSEEELHTIAAAHASRPSWPVPDSLEDVHDAETEGRGNGRVRLTCDDLLMSTMIWEKISVS